MYGRMFSSAIAGWNQHRGSGMSASLAFYSLLSLAPLITVAMSLATWFLGSTSARWIFKSKVNGIFGSSVADVVDSVLSAGFPPRESAFAALLGLAVLLYGVTGVAEELRSSLNLIWRVAPDSEESFLETALKRSRDLLLVFALCTLVLAISIVSMVTAAAGEFVATLLPAPEWVLTIANFGASLLLLFGLFFLIHRYVPDAAVTKNQAIIAALCTSLFFAAGKELVAIYIGKSTVGSVFGPGRSVVILLLWANFSATVLFLGAEFGKAYAIEEQLSREQARVDSSHRESVGAK